MSDRKIQVKNKQRLKAFKCKDHEAVKNCRWGSGIKDSTTIV